MYVAVIIDMDDVDPLTTIGPFETEEQADEAGEHICDILNDVTMPGHAHPHEWNSFVQSLDTVEETIIRFVR